MRLVIIAVAINSLLFALSSDGANAACSWTTLVDGTTASATQVQNNFDCLAPSPSFSGGVGIGTAAPASGLDVGSASSYTVGTFGPYKPLYLIYDWPMVGFNMYFDSVAGYRYGKGSASSFGSAIGVNPQSGTMYFWMTPASGNADATATVTAPLVLTRDGNLGLGTLSPGAMLDVGSGAASSVPFLRINGGTNTGAGSYINFSRGGVAKGYLGISDAFGYGGDDLMLLAPSSRNLLFASNNAEQMRLTSAGNIGIGTASPGQKLDVSGTIRQSNCTTSGALWVNGSGDIICSSDARLKHILGAYTDGLSAILQISPQRFRYKPTRTNPVETFVHAGFIAQNVKAVIPEASALQRDGYYSLDTTAVLAASVNAIKELDAANRRLEQTVRVQATELSDMKRRLGSLERSRLQTASR